jgi:dTMP kinase
MQGKMFITFEGADGSGKSTAITFAKDYLMSLGYKVHATRNPGGTELGIRLREILLNYDGEVEPLAEMLMFLADRAQHVSKEIKPLLEQGYIVLCDRYIDSTVAYQGYGRDLSIQQIETMNSIATQNLKPDLTLLFNISTEIAMQRIDSTRTKDRLESEMSEFHHKVALGYLEIARKEPERFTIIDANKALEKVQIQVKKAIEVFLA